MKYKRTKVIATFHISITDKDYNYSCYDITEKLWSDDEGKVTEDVVNDWRIIKEKLERLAEKENGLYNFEV